MFLKDYVRRVAPGGFIDLPAGYPSANVKQLVLRTGYARYSFATDGGSHTTNSGVITPATTWKIPSGALVMLASINVVAAVTSLGSATVAIGTSAGSAGNSILTATAKASLTLAAVLAGTANTTPFIMTAAGSITFTVGTADLTAGILECLVLYWIPQNS